MTALLVLGLNIAMLLLIWFRTDAFIEYARWIPGLRKWAKVTKFLAMQKEDGDAQYLDFLSTYHNCFFVRLITCPVCSATWLGILAGFLCKSFLLVLPSALLGLLFYMVVGKLLGNAR